MKKAVSLFLVAFFLTGCLNSNVPDDQNIAEETKPDTSGVDVASYLVEDTEENIISIQIPHTENMSAEERAFIRSFVCKKLQATTDREFDLTLSDKSVADVDRAYSQYYIILQSQITQDTDSHVSIVFSGLFNKKDAAHPTNWLFSFNYDRRTLEKIPFSQKYNINEELYLIFATYAEQGIKEECGGSWPAGWGSFSKAVCAQNAFLAGMNSETEFCYYMQETGVIISYPVPHAIGDYKQVLIPYDMLQSQTVAEASKTQENWNKYEITDATPEFSAGDKGTVLLSPKGKTE